MQKLREFVLTVCVMSLLVGHAPAAQGPATPATPSAEPPADYVIGPSDVLDIRLWGHENMTSTVVVRPDGRISLPLLDEFVAAGLTPEQLRAAVTQAGAKWFKDAPASVTVREIHSRQVFITGMVGQPGAYPLGGGLRVMQLIALAGGLGEYADRSKISVIREVGKEQVRFRFNHDQVRDGRNLEQNIELRPGDTVLVP